MLINVCSLFFSNVIVGDSTEYLESPLDIEIEQYGM